LTRTGVPNQDHFGSRLIAANIDDKLEFTTVYCPNGKNLEHADFGGKLAWYDDLTAQWQAANEGPAHKVICGDFNIVPKALDGWRGDAGEGSIFYTKEERGRLQALMDTGLTDLFRHRYPDAQEFSWWDYRGGAFHRKHGLRIDFILGTAGMLDLTDEVVIDREYRRKIDELTASDHAPVYADVSL
jgi:exodeoxyribonuclease-3